MWGLGLILMECRSQRQTLPQWLIYRTLRKSYCGEDTPKLISIRFLVGTCCASWRPSERGFGLWSLLDVRIKSQSSNTKNQRPNSTKCLTDLRSAFMLQLQAESITR